MRKILTVLFSLFLPVVVWGTETDHSVSAEANDAAAGEISDLVVILNNGDIVCNGYQFKLQLPAGITLAYDEEEEDYVYSLSSRYTKKKNMQLMIQDQGDGIYQFICLSLTNETIKGSNGPILTVGLQIDENLPGGDYQGFLKETILSKEDGQSILLPDTSFNVSVAGAPAVPITVRVNSYTRLYGSGNPVFEYSVEGGMLFGEPSISCEASETSPAGIYDIVISPGRVVNTDVTYVNGTLTVEKAPLLVIADDCERAQFEENPEFTLRYEGFVNGEMEDVLEVKPTATTAATTESAAGEYEIVVSGGEDENYNLSYQNGTLTVHASDGISNVIFPHTAEIYSIQGIPLSKGMTSLKELPHGVYIRNGKKVIVK